MPESIFDLGNNIQAGIPLSQYTAAITRAVGSSRELSGVWVTAELSDVRVAAGHCYMELIEKNEAGQTIAKLRANIWRSTYLQLRQKFFKATQRDITSGLKALVKGSATHHSLYGLSFNIIDIDPSYSLGDMERLRREIVMRLNKEGIANYNKERPLPLASQRIAVISAEGAAGFGDFMNHLTGNAEGFVFYPCLFQCAMQGDKVSQSIRDALILIESNEHLFDCVAIVRGGGATTDLNGFDDYELAKAVATCGLPVIVGIGHERDRNVLDEIAHTSLKTPTAVAGFFIDRLREAYDKVVATTDKLRLISNEIMRGEERRLSTLNGLLPQLAINKITTAKGQLNTITGKLPFLTKGRIDKERGKLDGIKNVIAGLGNSCLNREKMKIQGLVQLLKNISDNKINQFNRELTSLESLTKVLDPKNTLRRGYSITRINGKAVKSISQISAGDQITTTLLDGEIISNVN